MSLAAEFLDTQPTVREALAKYASDLEPFEMYLLKPELTFAEKLLGLHVKMLEGTEGARQVRTRHYYDVAQLTERSADVASSVEGSEFTSLLRSAAEVSNTCLGTTIDIDTLDISESPALNRTPEQARILRAAYESESEQGLYYRDKLSFEEILARMATLRARLADKRAGPGRSQPER